MRSTLFKILTREEGTARIQEILDSYITEEDRYTICEELKKINTYKLYDSIIHGQNHSEKVFLFSYILIKMIKRDNLYYLSDKDIQIIYDSSIYHDIGRYSDNDDSIHGYCGAIKIESVIDLKKYSKDDVEILKSIIDAHSVNDQDFESKIFPSYELEGLEDRFYFLIKILKDSDALDRKRLFMNCSSDLDASYFRLPYSKDLIELSTLLNQYFKDLNTPKELYSYDKLEEKEKLCLHSIGFDFFKLPLILKRGILSKGQMRAEGLNIPRNFDGSNLKDWISVVSLEEFDENNKAFREFSKHGINFLCRPASMVKPDSKLTLEESLKKGLPYANKSYDDERYVYKKILPSEIKAIALLNNNWDLDIRTARYITVTPSVDRLVEKIKYYKKMTNTTEEIKGLDILVKEYREFFFKVNREIINYEFKSTPLFNQVVIKTCEDINSYLQEMVYKYYKKQMYPGTEEDVTITVLEVIQYELEKDYKLNLLDLEAEFYLFLTPKDNNQKKKKI